MKSDLVHAEIHSSVSDKGQTVQNGIAERFMRTLKDEQVDYADYADFPDAQRQIAQWLEIGFNIQRIHSSLNYATPTKYEMSAHPRPFISVQPFFCPAFPLHHNP